MMLAVTVSGALERRYGAQGHQAIRAALAAYTDAAGAHLVALDDQNDMGALGLRPAMGSEPGTLLLALRAVKRALSGVDSVLLVGGNEIVPYWQMANPVTDRSIDADTVVLSDNPYGTDAEDGDQYLAPPLPVGRMTDFPKGSADDFVQAIDAATASRRGRAAHRRAAAVVNADWSEFSRSATNALPGPVDWHLSPGYLMDGSRKADADREFLYFNLHGFSDRPDWQGYDTVREDFVPAVLPDAFDRQYVSGSIVFAENCYGADIAGRTPANSCALRLVREGAAFVGATGLAYGSHLAPNFYLDDADALAGSFWNHLVSGVSLGAALQRARADYRDDPATPSTNPFKQKTLLQFILLGDPEWT
jgi:hypothetical protein